MAANYLPEVLETTEAERLATGFTFTEGPLWHPDGYWYFVDLRQNRLYRLPPGSTVDFREPTVWQKYRWWIVGALAVISLQAVTIFALVVQRRRRQRIPCRPRRRARPQSWH